MHIPSFVVSGLLLLGAGLTNAANTIDNEALCDGHPPAQGTKDYEMYMRNCQGIKEEDVNKPAKPVKKINCTELLKNGNKIDCQGLNRKACTLRTWEWAGCNKAPECKGKTGAEAKKCADDRDVLPFGAGVYYKGYMRAAVPQYRLKKTDEPSFKDLPCEELDDYNCTGLNRYFCEFRGWQAAGCHQAARCKGKSGKDKQTCCDSRDRDPEGPFNQTFALEFNKKCMA